MKKLSFNDTIKIGGYTGETVKSCIIKYGRESILEILRYYDLDDDVLKKYHYHKVIPEESPETENQVETVPSKEIDLVQILEESTFTYEDFKKGMEDTPKGDFSEWDDNYWDYPEDDDEWKYYTHSHSYKPWID